MTAAPTTDAGLAPAPTCVPAPAGAPASANPIGKERAHPTALMLWAALRDRSVADKRLVAAALDRRLGTELAGVKQERAFHALSVYIHEHGEFPSANGWDKWRAADPSRRVLPCTTAIAKAFGGWACARAACGDRSARPDVLSRRLLANGPAFSQARLLELISLFSQSRRGPLSRRHFLTWLKSDAPSPAPSGWGPFRRYGWDFPDALEEAGLGHRLDRSVASAAELCQLVRLYAASVEGPVIRSEFMSWWREADLTAEGDLAGIRPLASLFARTFDSWPAMLAEAELVDRSEAAPLRSLSTDQRRELLCWPRRAGETFGALMSRADFDSWRASMDGADGFIPRSSTLCEWFGGWVAVKVAAGIPGAGKLEDNSTRITYSDNDLVGWVRRAVSELGPECPGTHFERWRERELARMRETDARAKVPNADLIRRRLGGPTHSWEVVLNTVRDWQSA